MKFRNVYLILKVSFFLNNKLAHDQISHFNNTTLNDQFYSNIRVQQESTGIESARINTSRQHESTRVVNTSQHESTRVVNTSVARVSTNQHELDTCQNKSKTNLDRKK